MANSFSKLLISIVLALHLTTQTAASITFNVSNHGTVEKIHPASGRYSRSDLEKEQTPIDIYKNVYSDAKDSDGLVFSSFNDTISVTPLKKTTATKHSGFVEAAIKAYRSHHHLVVRPDDVWTAILSQFALFLANERHSRELRRFFTESGNKVLVGVSMDWGKLDDARDKIAIAFQEALKSKVPDKAFIPWLLPSFTTTTQNDLEVASFLLMGSLKNYYEYYFSMDILCGIPSVTLLGTKQDYEEILKRIDYLDHFDHYALNSWAKLLRPVIKEAFVAPFEDGWKGRLEKIEAGRDDFKSRGDSYSTGRPYRKYFYKNNGKISLHRSTGGGSTLRNVTALAPQYEWRNPWDDVAVKTTHFTFSQQICGVPDEPDRNYLDGWITAFTYFDREGNPPAPGYKSSGTQLLGESFPQVDYDKIAPSVIDAPINVELKYNGQVVDSQSLKVVAGVVGWASGELKDGGVSYESEDGMDDTLVPVSGWFVIDEKDEGSRTKDVLGMYRDKEGVLREERGEEVMGGRGAVMKTYEIPRQGQGAESEQ